MVNRSILIVRARQPFLEWLRSLPDPTNITLDEVSADNTAYLVQDCESDDEREKVLTYCYDPNRTPLGCSPRRTNGTRQRITATTGISAVGVLLPVECNRIYVALRAVEEPQRVIMEQ